MLDVPTPEGLPYENLTLETPDKIQLRCYLLPQKKELDVLAMPVEGDDTKTDDEVIWLVCQALSYRSADALDSLQAVGLRSSCSMEMEETMDTECLWQRSSI
ncbi:hypothetical protein H0H92_005011 [Tricholoma furcatifolium]|nr:hypothetical protein H0H92_005011 [Tricholoma furcatifolium]